MMDFAVLTQVINVCQLLIPFLSGASVEGERNRRQPGGLRKDPKPVARALPAFFANLLPEDKLREAMEKHHAETVRAENDFDLLVALGSDLPGAVRVVPSDRTVARLDNLSARQTKARFSLAGV
jgi:serine/threonine-protein kinase HipA